MYLLSTETNPDLARLAASAGSGPVYEAVMTELVKRFFGLARFLTNAAICRRSLAVGVEDFEELVQDALMVLPEAVKQYDPNRLAFEKWVAIWMRRQLLFETKELLRQDQRLRRIQFVTLDAPIVLAGGSSTDEQLEPSELIADPNARTPYQVLLAQESFDLARFNHLEFPPIADITPDRVNHDLQQLFFARPAAPRQYAVLRRRFNLLDGLVYQPPMPWPEVASDLGISQFTAKELQRRGLVRLRAHADSTAVLGLLSLAVLN